MELPQNMFLHLAGGGAGNGLDKEDASRALEGGEPWRISLNPTINRGMIAWHTGSRGNLLPRHALLMPIARVGGRPLAARGTELTRTDQRDRCKLYILDSWESASEQSEFDHVRGC